jgi:Transposase protein
MRALIEQLKKEKEINKEIKQQKTDTEKRLKGVESEKKQLQKINDKQQKDLQDLLLEKLKLREAIEAAGGAVSIQARDDIVRTALKDIFSPAQLDRILKKKKTHWTQEDYGLAISFLCQSSRGYRFARNVLNIPLPAASTVRKKIARFPLEEGLATFALDIMKAKGQCMTPLQRATELTFDEVYIAADMVFDPVTERVLGPFNKTQVIMAQGVFGRWKNVVYFQHNEDITPDILSHVIEELHKSGFPVVSVTCDMGRENRDLYSALGVNEDNPSFDHPVTGHKIACFHDAPHLLKLARNHLIDHGMTLNPNDPVKKQNHATKEPLLEMINKSHLVELHGHNVLWKHIEARQCERQNVKLAAQVLSNKTSICLCEAKKEGHLRSKDCQVLKIP